MVNVNEILIIPAVSYGYETWSLTSLEGSVLMGGDLRMLRKIFEREKKTGRKTEKMRLVICVFHVTLL
jgi:hypothetical protein